MARPSKPSNESAGTPPCETSVIQTGFPYLFPSVAGVEFAIPAGGLFKKLRVPGNVSVAIPPMDLGGKNLLGAFIKVSDVIFIADRLQPLAAPTDIDSQSQVKVIESKPPGRVDQLLFQHVRYYKVKSVPI